MAKRNTDTDKWKKAFIKSLPPDYKLLWLFILDECDHAGIWHVDFEVAAIRLSSKDKKVDINEVEAKKLFDGKIHIFGDHDSKWFITDFVPFQYGQQLSPKNRLHMAVKGLLEKNGLYGLNGTLGALNAPNTIESIESSSTDKVNTTKSISGHTTCITIYHDWYLERFKMKPQIDGGDAKGMKLILDYLNKNSENEDQAILTWQAVLDNYDKWSKFYKQQTRIRQINTFLSNIITELKIKVNATKSFADSVKSRVQNSDTTSN